MTDQELQRLFEEVRTGAVDPAAASARVLHVLRAAPFEDLGFARVDTHRELRQGFPEVILGLGKTPAQIAAIASRIVARGQALAYLIAPPLEATYSLDAALKAADVEMKVWYNPPSETNFSGGLLTGSQSACKAACAAFRGRGDIRLSVVARPVDSRAHLGHNNRE